MGDQLIQQQQEQETGPYTHKGGDKSQLAHVSRLVHGRDDQTPDRSRHHDTGGKAGEGALEPLPHLAFEKKYKCRTDGRAEEGNQNGTENFKLHIVCSFRGKGRRVFLYP